MHQKKHGIFSKVMSTALTAACVLSTVAFIGTATSPTVDAANTYTKPEAGSPATFSWDNASVYFLLTDRFCNGNTSNDHSYNRGLDKNGNAIDTNNPKGSAMFMGGDFAGITQKIEEGYFEDLGVNAIWMSAPYEQIHGYVLGGGGDPSFAHYSYHGYYVLDYTESDKNFGTKEEFKELVDTAHEHGIRIVLDVVMNHAGYQSIYDMNEYGFGALNGGWEDYYYAHQNGVNSKDYHQKYINYNSDAAGQWAKWWGTEWVRCGLPGYTKGSGDIEGCLADLPDFRTNSGNVGLPEILKTKWTKEGTYNEKVSKYGSSNTVTGYISDWLAEWVREFGVDGFRCDTAKHIELSNWKILKDKCVAALKEWKSKNPDKKMDDLDFWMTGEHFGHGVGKDGYYTQGGFDSMINFELAPAAGNSNIPQAGKVEEYYSRYASSINNDDSFNVLTYISSHDTVLARGDRKYAGSVLLMMPGGIQIFYGDETNRPLLAVPSDSDDGAGHKFRSFMNWNSIDKGVLEHWQKLGQFRRDHIAVGAGQHKVISSYDSTNGYTFSRTYNKNGIEDKVVVTLFASANKDITIDVSSVWSDGIEITNFYDGSTCKVSGGKVTFNSGANGTILMQEPQGAKGKVTVKHINSDTGEVIKTETMAGLIGDAYTTSPDSELSNFYKVDRVVGQTTGTYSETEATVTYYYTFDSANNGIIKVSYVDAATGAAIADPDTTYGKIGSTYSVSPKTIKNYEVDESLTTGATGIVKSGTTTVVFKYNYVEPTNVMIHYYNSNNWSSVAMYVYDESGATVEEYAGKWPGKTMEAEGDGWFFGEVDAETATFIANNNNGGAQDPTGVGSAGYAVTGEVWVKNGKVYPTGKVNVRYVSSNGKVLATETLKGMADGSTKYQTSAKTFDGYTLTETPSNASGVYTENAVTVTYVYSGGQPITPLVNNSKVTASSIKLGSSVTLIGAASGGTAPYQYKYEYRKSTSSYYTTINNYSESTSASFKPSSTGTYKIKISVMDSAGEVAEKYLNITVTSSQALTAKCSISATTVNLGTTLTINAGATGGTAPYQYKIEYKKPNTSTYTTLKAYGTKTSATYTPTSAGAYKFKISIKDSTGKVVEKYYDVTVKGSTPLTAKCSINASSINVNNILIIEAGATGGVAPYQYKFEYRKSTTSAYTTISPYGSTSSMAFTPTSAGIYKFRVSIKDSTGKVVTKYYDITVKSNNPLTAKCSISATTVNLGTTLTINAGATGGTAPYQYKIEYKKPNTSTYTTLKAYGTKTSATYTPTSAGSYKFKVSIKDSTGKVVTKYYDVTVKGGSTLTAKCSISATTVNLGTALTINAGATGGTAPYQYKIEYKKSTASSYTQLKPYNTTSSVAFVTSSAGAYKFKISIKDSTGKVVEKYYDVTVKA